ncbi:MAG: tail sheath protein [Candidatus Brocadiaceae bacterium]|nr:tail sheath protein [Candidatus Brocadiaceae bacterium]
MQVFRYFFENTRLFKYEILKQVEARESDQGISSRALKVDERIIHYLFEVNSLDASLAPFATLKEFGGFIPNGYLAYAVYGFFAEGGTSCYVVRTCHYTTITDGTSKTSAASAETLKDADAKGAIRVTASSDGKWGDGITVVSGAATDLAGGFKLVVKYKSAKGDAEDVESFDNLSMHLHPGRKDTFGRFGVAIRERSPAFPVY